MPQLFYIQRRRRTCLKIQSQNTISFTKNIDIPLCDKSDIIKDDVIYYAVLDFDLRGSQLGPPIR